MKHLTNKLSKYIIVPALSLCALLIAAAPATAQKSTVRTVAEFNAAVKNAQPGAHIVLANGVWKDAELVVAAKGTSEQPVTLSAETNGGVTLEGKSNLRISGEHLLVQGLVFKNGYTPATEVISFRTNDSTFCNNCRVTECVIDDYSNPERFEADYWVALYGKNNRFDHNYLAGKRNLGVTLAVRLEAAASSENSHLIDHNYFGHRPILGSNGGETIRIGTSHNSMVNSKTRVENNYFDRCNGEHEIISNKSCQNEYRNNTFFECQGTLTMRHGNETLVESNYFFGNGKPNTGGIRIINEKQKVINNYCEGLTGYRFRGALVIMNGVPNSAPNRYMQVKNSEASNNTFINCDYIQLAAGADKERTATPQSTLVSNNIFYNTRKADIFTVYDDISGVTFKNNLISPNIQPFQQAGFYQKALTFNKDKDGLWMPAGNLTVGMKKKGEIATPANTGPSWYGREEKEQTFNGGKIIPAEAGENTLADAVLKAGAGDIIELQGGDYVLTKIIDVNFPITIRAAAGSREKPVLTFRKSSLFNLENGGALSLKGLVVSGKEADDMAGNAVIRTSRQPMNHNYKLFIDSCDFRDMDVNYTFDVLKVYQSTFADSVVLRHSTFTNITGSVLPLNKETEDVGIYNAENVVIDHCAFTNIGGAVLSLYRGGSDESTFGPMLTISQSAFDNVGQNKHNSTGASLNLHGVQLVNIRNNTFKDSKPIRLHMVNGEPVTNIVDSRFINTPKIVANDAPYTTSNLTYQ